MTFPPPDMWSDAMEAEGIEPWEEVFHCVAYGEPKAQPRFRSFAFRRAGKPTARVYDPGTAEGWKSTLAEAFRPHIPPKPLACPLRLEVDAYFKRPKRLLRKKDPDGRIPHDLKPDFDNLGKPFGDVMQTLGIVDDDKRIAQAEICSWYCERDTRPRASITLYQWGPTT